MLDTLLSSYSRIEYAKQSYYTACLIDSSYVTIDSLIISFDKIITDTRFTEREKINARFLTGLLYEKKYQLDSAVSMFNLIYTYNCDAADSMIVNWKLKRIEADLNWDSTSTDTFVITSYDSLNALYLHNSTKDLMLDSLHFHPKSAHTQYETDSYDLPLICKIDYIASNPVVTNSDLKYTISEDCDVILDIVNESGKTVLNLVDIYQKAGTYLTRIDVSKLSPGLYFVILKACNQKVSSKLIVHK